MPNTVSKSTIVEYCALTLLFVNVICMPRQAIADLATTIQSVKASIVAIGTFEKTRRPPSKFLGTGFVVHDSDYVITSAHVIPETTDTDNKEKLAVYAGTGNAVPPRFVSVVATDVEHDVVILKLKGAPLPSLKLGDSDKVQEGQLVAFTGFPIGPVLGLYPATHRGIISAITPIIQPTRATSDLSVSMINRLKRAFDVFQLDATAYPGNSGSPLYDPETGVVIGMLNTVFIQETKEAVLEKPSGIAYAIPIKYAVNLLTKIKTP